MGETAEVTKPCIDGSGDGKGRWDRGISDRPRAGPAPYPFAALRGERAYFCVHKL